MICRHHHDSEGPVSRFQGDVDFIFGFGDEREVTLHGGVVGQAELIARQDGRQGNDDL